MLYRKFGKTNETVSALAFGCMRLPFVGKDFAQIDEAKATAMICHAIDEGVNYVDTAYPYHGHSFTSPGASEPFVGRALRDGYRAKVKLATKLPSWLVKTAGDFDKFLNEQLQRLETDVIDFYLVHSLNKENWAAVKACGIGECLDRAIKDGRIKHAGFSFHDEISLFKEIVDFYDWSFCQIQYNYLDENFQAGTEGLRYAAQKGLGIAVMEPMRGGNLSDLPQSAQAIFNRAYGKRTPTDWALRWVWNHPEVATVLSGMTTMEHVVENLATACVALPNLMTAEKQDAVAKVRDHLAARIKVGCTACGYCLPCPVSINIPACFSAYNDHWMFDATPSARQRYHIWARFAAPASQCTECGQCEDRCPQGIAIREELKSVVKLFE